MTTLEQIRNVRAVLGTAKKFTSADSISKATGISYHFLKALVDQGLVYKDPVGGYVWASKRNPNVRTYKKLRDIVSKSVASQQAQVSEVVLRVNDTLKVSVRDGVAVISRNGVKIEVQDLVQLEKLVKAMS